MLLWGCRTSEQVNIVHSILLKQYIGVRFAALRSVWRLNHLKLGKRRLLFQLMLRFFRNAHYEFECFVRGSCDAVVVAAAVRGVGEGGRGVLRGARRLGARCAVGVGCVREHFGNVAYKLSYVSAYCGIASSWKQKYFIIIYGFIDIIKYLTATHRPVLIQTVHYEL